MSTNKILLYLGCTALVLGMIIAFAATSQGTGWESTNQLQAHENAITQRAAINAAIVGGILHGAPTGDTLNPPSGTNWFRSIMLIGAFAGLLLVAGVMAYLLLINRKTIAAQLSSFAATPQPVPVEEIKQ